MGAGVIVLIVVAAVVLLVLIRTVRIVPQARAGIVERLGRYHRTLEAGLALIVPLGDPVKPPIDLRGQVGPVPPPPVVPEDHLLLNLDTVVYYGETDAE